MPAILAGDLNAKLDSPVLVAFSKRWQLANDKELRTIPVRNPKRQIDFIMSQPIGRWRTVDVRVLDESTASDHRPIFAVLELLPDPKD